VGVLLTQQQGLAEYSHVFVLFLFHENSNMHKMAKPGRAEGLPAQTRAQRAAGRRAGGSAAAGGQEEGGEEEAEEGTLTRLLRERHFSALIEPPAMKGQRTGVLSTRSPHRPNAIGLSLCRLVAVHDQPSGQRMLVLAGCDLLAGTPVVDVKPYAPYDCPVCLGGLVGVPRRGMTKSMSTAS
jgi:tRNA (Thr-GGU) A37 N-methylase